ncbi:MAG: CDGSH iron-sulfur domain-containing protein [Gammaproteobacteria bacterium]|nr:CDGSH iron-sulfur domain-containing protein [Gammaproteobacteria bacterium]
MTKKNKPVNKTLLPGNYLWCGCGKASDMPFCSKKPDGMPCVESKPFVVKEEGWFRLCACGETMRPPYCDGSHNTL